MIQLQLSSFYRQNIFMVVQYQCEDQPSSFGSHKPSHIETRENFLQIELDVLAFMWKKSEMWIVNAKQVFNFQLGFNWICSIDAKRYTGYPTEIATKKNQMIYEIKDLLFGHKQWKLKDLRFCWLLVLELRYGHKVFIAIKTYNFPWIMIHKHL